VGRGETGMKCEESGKERTDRRRSPGKARINTLTGVYLTAEERQRCSNAEKPKLKREIGRGSEDEGNSKEEEVASPSRRLPKTDHFQLIHCRRKALRATFRRVCTRDRFYFASGRRG
jgi:hypothetical protein